MKRHIRRAVFLPLLLLVGLVAAAALGMVWRVSQGPVSLSFLRQPIVTAINKQLGGLQADMGEAVLEVDRNSYVPSLRFLNIVLRDSEGEALASAPKAAVTLDKAAILQGRIVATSFDLIGPKVSARRNLDGRFELGFDNSVLTGAADVVIDQSDFAETQNEKSDLGGDAGAVPTPPPMSKKLFDLLSGQDKASALSNLEVVRISEAEIELYDEANDSRWRSPNSDLAFRRMPYGFIVAAKSQISSKGEPWQLEFTASYQTETRNFAVNAAVANFVPADVSDQIFALSDFAKVTVPLSGQLQMDVSEQGLVKLARGQLIAAAGKISFPEYFLRSLPIDEGALEISYDGDGQTLEIVDSSLLVGGTQVALKGRLQPQRAQDGRVTGLDISLNTKNARIDTQGSIRDPVKIDSITIESFASFDERKLAIRKASVRSGAAQIDIAGNLQGGTRSIGFNIDGKVRNMSSELLKEIWPPIVAPASRAWVSQNVEQGMIDDGSFTLRFAPDALARTLADRQIDEGALDIGFNMSKVTSHYFKDLPVLAGASGRVEIKDDALRVTIAGGSAELPSGEKVRVAKGRFSGDHLLSRPIGRVDFDLEGTVAGLIEAGKMPALNQNLDNIKLPKLEGKAAVALSLQFPMVKAPPPAEVNFKTGIKLSKVAAPSVSLGIDLTEGEFDILLSKQSMQVKGPARLNGFPAEVNWTRSKDGDAQIRIATSLDDETRKRMGIKVADYMSGDMPVEIEVVGSGEAQMIKVDADLSNVSLRVQSMGWSRGKVPGTRASFEVVSTEKGRVIDKLVVRGKGLAASGSIDLTKSNQLKTLRLENVSLDGETSFAARISPKDGYTDVAVAGQNFDATPYIKNLISPAKTGASVDSGVPTGNFRINARFARVFAFRGEELREVEADFVTNGKAVTSAKISGKFLNGLPLNISVEPAEGARELRVTSSDGGSAMRAANFYSKIAGGELEFYALMLNRPGSPIRNGELKLRNFAVRNEAALAELDSRGKPKKSGPRRDGIQFKRLSLPFTTDEKFVRLGDVLLRGPEMGATAQGLIRKADGRIDITGTYIPAYGLNAAIGEIPIFGDILTGGNKEGIFGITYFMHGSINKPKMQVNPLSLVAPGVFRKLFEFDAPRGPKSRRKDDVQTGTPY